MCNIMLYCVSNLEIMIRQIYILIFKYFFHRAVVSDFQIAELPKQGEYVNRYVNSQEIMISGKIF